MIRALIKVTDWEKVSTGRRLLCAFGRVLLLFGIMAAIAFVLYVNQYSIEAKVWHWKHGYSTTIGKYEIPVPDHWLVRTENSTNLGLMNIAPIRYPRDGKFRVPTMINVDVYLQQRGDHATGAGWEDSWLTHQRRLLASDKVESVEEKTLQFANESMTCVGGKELSAMLRDKPNLSQMVDVVSLNCMSEGGLSLMFVGEPSEVQPFYTFASQIQRRN
jgi:hypothetical protein